MAATLSWPSSTPRLKATSGATIDVPKAPRPTSRSALAREPEAVDQAEAEGERPAPFGLVAPRDVLDAHEHDGGSDERLDDAAGELDHVERGERERHGVREREAGDDRGDGPEAAADDQQANEEKKVVVAGPDVADAEGQVLAEGRQRWRAQRLGVGGDGDFEAWLLGTEELLAEEGPLAHHGEDDARAGDERAEVRRFEYERAPRGARVADHHLHLALARELDPHLAGR
jgi:hypothetical protein